jgi:murein DD-endopeptidase MepM/ murein hydrolase activator NlpD
MAAVPKVKAQRPTDRDARISNPFGVPGPYAARHHTGIDYAVPVGTKVVSPRNGRVIHAGYDNDYGNHVIIEWFTGTKRYLLAHLSKIEVHSGQKVKRGQEVGRSGNSGNSTGPHLHAEQRHKPFGYWDHEKPNWD